MTEPEKPNRDHPLPHSMRDRKPWPMWPIGLSIAIFIAVYTFINLQYRKEGKAYEPFEAMMERKNAIVGKNMYDWYGLKTTRSADPSPIDSPAEATTRLHENALDAVIPEQLKYSLTGRPILLPDLTKTASEAQLAPGAPLRLQLHVPGALADDERLQLLAFYKEGDLYLLPALFVEKIEEIEPETFDAETAPATFEIPTDPFAAETVKVHLLTQDRLAEWEIENLDPTAAVLEDKTATPNP